MCQRSQEALISLPLLPRSIPPFQLAPQFTFEQHIKGKQRGPCVSVCVCVKAMMLRQHCLQADTAWQWQEGRETKKRDGTETERKRKWNKNETMKKCREQAWEKRHSPTASFSLDKVSQSVMYTLKQSLKRHTVPGRSLIAWICRV